MLKQNSNQFFPQPSAQQLIRACQLIESDANYQPNITNQALMNLVRDENGNARHTPRRSALAIQPADFDAVDENNNTIGLLYQIKIAKKSCIGGEGYPAWHIDDSVVVLVNKVGKISLHRKEDAEKADYNNALNHLTIDNFLNCESLHSHLNDNDENSNVNGANSSQFKS